MLAKHTEGPRLLRILLFFLLRLLLALVLAHPQKAEGALLILLLFIVVLFRIRILIRRFLGIRLDQLGAFLQQALALLLPL